MCISHKIKKDILLLSTGGEQKHWNEIAQSSLVKSNRYLSLYTSTVRDGNSILRRVHHKVYFNYGVYKCLCAFLSRHRFWRPIPIMTDPNLIIFTFLQYFRYIIRQIVHYWKPMLIESSFIGSIPNFFINLTTVLHLL